MVSALRAGIPSNQILFEQLLARDPRLAIAMLQALQQRRAYGSGVAAAPAPATASMSPLPAALQQAYGSPGSRSAAEALVASIVRASAAKAAAPSVADPSAAMPMNAPAATPRTPEQQAVIDRASLNSRAMGQLSHDLHQAGKMLGNDTLDDIGSVVAFGRSIYGDANNPNGRGVSANTIGTGINALGQLTDNPTIQKIGNAAVDVADVVKSVRSGDAVGTATTIGGMVGDLTGNKTIGGAAQVASGIKGVLSANGNVGNAINGASAVVGGVGTLIGGKTGQTLGGIGGVGGNVAAAVANKIPGGAASPIIGAVQGVAGLFIKDAKVNAGIGVAGGIAAAALATGPVGVVAGVVGAVLSAVGLFGAKKGKMGDSGQDTYADINNDGVFDKVTRDNDNDLKTYFGVQDKATLTLDESTLGTTWDRGSTLAMNQVLGPGQTMTSANGRFQARMQEDGNLCVYDTQVAPGEQPKLTWQSNTAGFNASSLMLGGDGNLVTYRPSPEQGKFFAAWNTGAAKAPPPPPAPVPLPGIAPEEREGGVSLETQLAAMPGSQPKGGANANGRVWIIASGPQAGAQVSNLPPPDVALADGATQKVKRLEGGGRIGFRETEVEVRVAPAPAPPPPPSNNFFLNLQDDGNLVVNRGSSPADNQGLVWGSTGNTGQVIMPAFGPRQQKMDHRGLFDRPSQRSEMEVKDFDGDGFADLRWKGNVKLNDGTGHFGAEVSQAQAEATGAQRAAERAAQAAQAARDHRAAQNRNVDVNNDGVLDFVRRDVENDSAYEIELGKQDKATLTLTPRTVGTTRERGSELRNDQVLVAGQTMTSDNGRWQLQMQRDGNLVLRDRQAAPDAAPVWQSNTAGFEGSAMMLGGDGNLVTYRPTEERGQYYAAWNSGSAQPNEAAGKFFIKVQDDGNVTVNRGTGVSDNQGNLWGSQQSAGALVQSQASGVKQRIEDASAYDEAKQGRPMLEVADFDGNGAIDTRFKNTVHLNDGSGGSSQAIDIAAQAQAGGMATAAAPQPPAAAGTSLGVGTAQPGPMQADAPGYTPYANPVLTGGRPQQEQRAPVLPDTKIAGTAPAAADFMQFAPGTATANAFTNASQFGFYDPSAPSYDPRDTVTVNGATMNQLTQPGRDSRAGAFTNATQFGLYGGGDASGATPGSFLDAQDYGLSKSTPLVGLTPKAADDARYLLFKNPDTLLPYVVQQTMGGATAKPQASGSNGRNGSNTAAASGGLVRPLEGAINTADKHGEGDGHFGTARSNASGTHKGLDIVGKVGAPVGAAGDGKVVFAGDAGTYGNTVVVHHGDGRETVYAHMSKLDVRVGETVRAGEQVGRVGRTGNTPQGGDAHLHFEVREGGHGFGSTGYLTGKAVDPAKAFGQTTASAHEGHAHGAAGGGGDGEVTAADRAKNLYGAAGSVANPISDATGRPLAEGVGVVPKDTRAVQGAADDSGTASIVFSDADAPGLSNPFGPRSIYIDTRTGEPVKVAGLAGDMFRAVTTPFVGKDRANEMAEQAKKNPIVRGAANVINGAADAASNAAGGSANPVTVVPTAGERNIEKNGSSQTHYQKRSGATGDESRTPVYHNPNAESQGREGGGTGSGVGAESMSIQGPPVPSAAESARARGRSATLTLNGKSNDVVRLKDQNLTVVIDDKGVEHPFKGNPTNEQIAKALNKSANTASGEVTFSITQPGDQASKPSEPNAFQRFTNWGGTVLSNPQQAWQQTQNEVGSAATGFQQGLQQFPAEAGKFADGVGRFFTPGSADQARAAIDRQQYAELIGKPKQIQQLVEQVQQARREGKLSEQQAYSQLTTLSNLSAASLGNTPQTPMGPPAPTTLQSMANKLGGGDPVQTKAAYDALLKIGVDPTRRPDMVGVDPQELPVDLNRPMLQRDTSVRMQLGYDGNGKPLGALASSGSSMGFEPTARGAEQAFNMQVAYSEGTPIPPAPQNAPKEFKDRYNQLLTQYTLGQASAVVQTLADGVVALGRGNGRAGRPTIDDKMLQFQNQRLPVYMPRGKSDPGTIEMKAGADGNFSPDFNARETGPYPKADRYQKGQPLATRPGNVGFNAQSRPSEPSPSEGTTFVTPDFTIRGKSSASGDASGRRPDNETTAIDLFGNSRRGLAGDNRSMQLTTGDDSRPLKPKPIVTLAPNESGVLTKQQQSSFDFAPGQSYYAQVGSVPGQKPQLGLLPSNVSTSDGEFKVPMNEGERYNALFGDQSYFETGDNSIHLHRAATSEGQLTVADDGSLLLDPSSALNAQTRFVGSVKRDPLPTDTLEPDAAAEMARAIAASTGKSVTLSTTGKVFEPQTSKPANTQVLPADNPFTRNDVTIDESPIPIELRNLRNNGGQQPIGFVSNEPGEATPTTPSQSPGAIEAQRQRSFVLGVLTNRDVETHSAVQSILRKHPDAIVTAAMSPRLREQIAAQPMLVFGHRYSGDFSTFGDPTMRAVERERSDPLLAPNEGFITGHEVGDQLRLNGQQPDYVAAIVCNGVPIAEDIARHSGQYTVGFEEFVRISSNGKLTIGLDPTLNPSDRTATGLLFAPDGSSRELRIRMPRNGLSLDEFDRQVAQAVNEMRATQPQSSQPIEPVPRPRALAFPGAESIQNRLSQFESEHAVDFQWRDGNLFARLPSGMEHNVIGGQLATQLGATLATSAEPDTVARLIDAVHARLDVLDLRLRLDASQQTSPANNDFSNIPLGPVRPQGGPSFANLPLGGPAGPTTQTEGGAPTQAQKPFRIAIYDSSNGGILASPTLKQQIEARLGQPVQIVVMGDHGNAPYGNRPYHEIPDLVNRSLITAEDLGVDQIIIACNTACTTLPFGSGQGIGTDIVDIVGLTSRFIVEQGGERPAVLATAATVGSNAYQNGVNDILSAGGQNLRNVQQVPAPRLADLVNQLAHTVPARADEVQQAVNEYIGTLDPNTTTLWLCCTHYPSLTPFIERALADRGMNTRVIDPMQRIAQQAADDLITKQNLGIEGQGNAGVPPVFITNTTPEENVRRSVSQLTPFDDARVLHVTDFGPDVHLDLVRQALSELPSEGPGGGTPPTSPASGGPAPDFSNLGLFGVAPPTNAFEWFSPPSSPQSGRPEVQYGLPAPTAQGPSQITAQIGEPHDVVPDSQLHPPAQIFLEPQRNDTYRLGVMASFGLPLLGSVDVRLFAQTNTPGGVTDSINLRDLANAALQHRRRDRGSNEDEVFDLIRGTTQRNQGGTLLAELKDALSGGTQEAFLAARNGASPLTALAEYWSRNFPELGFFVTYTPPISPTLGEQLTGTGFNSHIQFKDLNELLRRGQIQQRSDGKFDLNFRRGEDGEIEKDADGKLRLAVPLRVIVGEVANNAKALHAVGPIPLGGFAGKMEEEVAGYLDRLDPALAEALVAGLNALRYRRITKFPGLNLRTDAVVPFAPRSPHKLFDLPGDGVRLQIGSEFDIKIRDVRLPSLPGLMRLNAQPLPDGWGNLRNLFDDLKKEDSDELVVENGSRGRLDFNNPDYYRYLIGKASLTGRSIFGETPILINPAIATSVRQNASGNRDISADLLRMVHELRGDSGRGEGMIDQSEMASPTRAEPRVLGGFTFVPDEQSASGFRLDPLLHSDSGRQASVSGFMANATNYSRLVVATDGAVIGVPAALMDAMEGEALRSSQEIGDITGWMRANRVNLLDSDNEWVEYDHADAMRTVVRGARIGSPLGAEAAEVLRRYFKEVMDPSPTDDEF